ncbi:hypothetical protein CPB86DRAFT_778842 [Serendipita vermifera]|nr:hypothetical protein CPB86DRAFT_778842 [Serendipita vermifera]
MDPFQFELMHEMLSNSEVETEPEEHQMLRTLFKAKATAEKEKGQPPFPLTYTPPFLILAQMTMQRYGMEKREREQETNFKIHTTYIGQKIEYSTRPLRELKPIRKRKKVCFFNCRTFLTRLIRQGHYLLCRIISVPFRIVAVAFAIEDTKGWSQMVSLYNFPGTLTATGVELDTIFPLFSVIAIREPLVKMALAGSDSHIRIDSPSDIIFIKPSDPISKRSSWTTGSVSPFKMAQSMTAWKARGDEHFKAKQFFAAVMAYTYALEKDPLQITIRLNRCLAYIRSESFAYALRDAKKVLGLDDLTKSDKIKALYRGAQAEYGEARYEEAKEWYIRCLEEDPNLNDAKAGCRRCEARMKEKKGDYDWKPLFDGALSPAYRPDIAEFQGSIAITPLSHRGGGRGVTATSDIGVGELLVVARPFAGAFQEDAKEFLWALDLLTERVESTTTYISLEKSIEKLALNPSRCAELFNLYGGDTYSPVPKDSSLSLDALPDNPLDFPIDVDPARIHAIGAFNRFGFPAVASLASFRPNEHQEVFRDEPCALYVLPSYFNHSCIPNAGHEYFGDIMVIRAIQKISKGEEIFLSYTKVSSYDIRKENLKKWKLDCNCELCICDREVGPQIVAKREQIHDQLRSESLSIPRIRRLLKQLNDTYPPHHPSFRPESSTWHHRLALTLESADRVDSALLREAIQEEMNALDKLGILVNDRKMTPSQPRKDSNKALPIATDRAPYWTLEPVMIASTISGLFVALGVYWRAQNWLRAALWLENIKMGGGIPLFRRRYEVLLAPGRSAILPLLDSIERETSL